MLEIGHFSARVDRDRWVEPIAAHLASVPDGEDHVITPRVSGAALLIVTRTALLDTEFREHGSEVRTLGYRLDDPSLVIALDSQPDDGHGGPHTGWRFRFPGGQGAIAGH